MKTPTQTLADRAADVEAGRKPYAISFPQEEDHTKQEFRDAADINNIMDRFGPAAPQREVVYTSRDFDLDFQTGLDSLAQAKRVYRRLPAELKKDFPTWQAVLHGITTGELALKIGEQPEPPAPLPPTAP